MFFCWSYMQVNGEKRWCHKLHTVPLDSILNNKVMKKFMDCVQGVIKELWLMTGSIKRKSPIKVTVYEKYLRLLLSQLQLFSESPVLPSQRCTFEIHHRPLTCTQRMLMGSQHLGVRANKNEHSSPLSLQKHTFIGRDGSNGASQIDGNNSWTKS